MTLEESIKHCDEVISQVRDYINEYYEDDASGYCTDIEICEGCIEEHQQLKDWLIELKTYRNQEKVGVE